MPNSKPDLPERCLPSVERLLVAGGDARIALDPETGLNKYGCRPFPDPALLAFGSSTASTVSEVGFEAANRLRERLLAGEVAAEMARIRRELLLDVADLEVGLAFASSGTDAHVMAARHAARVKEAGLSVVMVEEAETGSGVAAGLASLGLNARQGAASPECVALRTGDGTPRPPDEVDAEVVGAVESAVTRGARVLLVMTDQSKTGLIAPGVSCVIELFRRHRGKLEVLVDACQYRIAPPTLRAYLQQGFMVALTGSKFFTGPSFSAALLLPGSLAQSAARIETQCHSQGGLGADFERAGSLLRWEAALAELRRFRALPQHEIVDGLRAFSEAVQQRLIIDPRFEPLAVRPLDRRPLQMAQSWDHLQTIFPFLLCRADTGRTPCSREETQRVYRQLQEDRPAVEDGPLASLRCQLGQPVACGVRAGIEVSALRLCLSARLLSDALESNAIARLIEEALLVLDKTAWLVDRLAIRG